MLRLEVKVPAGWTLVYGKTPLKALMRKAGNEVAARARALIRAKAPRGKVRASVPGQPPVSRTGTLANSIKASPWRSGEGVTIRDVAFYALFLETGAKGGVSPGRRPRGFTGKWRGKRNSRKGVVGSRVLLPRPFLTRALDEVANTSLSQRIVGAVTEGIEFRRGKV
jgi:hypothetical protein